jgi:hypothetical protein
MAAGLAALQARGEVTTPTVTPTHTESHTHYSGNLLIWTLSFVLDLNS